MGLLPLSEETRLPLVRLFNTENAKVLDFFLANEGLNYTEDQISELTLIPKQTLQKSLQSLLDERIIKCSVKKNGISHYMADLSSPRVSGLLSYTNSTLYFDLDTITPLDNPQK